MAGLAPWGAVKYVIVPSAGRAGLFVAVIGNGPPP